MAPWFSRNVYAATGTGASSIALPWRPNQLIVANDSTVAGVHITIGSVTFNLQPDETLSVDFSPDAVRVSGASWRVLGFG